MPKFQNCNLCGVNKARFLFIKQGVNIFSCKNCGLVYRNHQLLPEQEIAVHREASLEKESSSEFIISREVLLRYLLAQLNTQAQDAGIAKGKLLDIGCQFGYFLQLARKDAWQTFGLDVSPSAANFAREKLKLDVLSGTLKEANFPNQHFDAVTLWEVLNQMPQPLQELEEIRRVLKQDGVICFRLQNAAFHLCAHYFYQLFKIVFKLLGIPDISNFHIYEFSPRAIKLLLKRAGFRDVRVKNSRLTEGDLYRSFGRRASIMVGGAKKIFSLFVFVLYCASATRIVLAPSMIVLARK